ncbi:MAG: hypothetical protein ACI83N_000944 [Hydrogenophaga sp.]|jgi:hypothetical protein
MVRFPSTIFEALLGKVDVSFGGPLRFLLEAVKDVHSARELGHGHHAKGARFIPPLQLKNACVNRGHGLRLVAVIEPSLAASQARVRAAIGSKKRLPRRQPFLQMIANRLSWRTLQSR